MARIIGTPGESAAARAAVLVLLVPASIVVFVGIPSAYALIYSGGRWGCAGLILMVAGIAGALFWNRDMWPEAAELMREGVNYFRGAQGEFAVHQALRALPNEFIVFHDFHPIDLTTGKPVKWNVDHIVVGPTGVFVIDAKNYRHASVQSADKSGFTRSNVRQVQRNALELKDRLVRWSRNELAGLFVVPVVVYTQPEARLERLREGAVRTIPLRLMINEVQTHSEAAIDQEKAGRISRVLFAQVERSLQYAFKSEFDAYGELSKAARYAARDARLAGGTSVDGKAVEPQGVPAVCPQCGGKLVRRVAGRGPRAGKPFLSCENFRTTGCKYGLNLEE